ncbi:MAG: hypothetical protein ACKOW8_02590 [Flavobacteriales bacterium]
MSENYGTTWIDISQGLPQVGINHIEIVPYLNDEIVFIATDAGVYYKPSQGQWLLLGNNLPPMRTEEVVLSGSRIYAATYARSIWSIDVADIIYSPVSQDGLHAPTILGANTINGELRTNLPTEIEIYDLKGSCIWRSSSVQTTHTLPEVQGGIYIAVMRDCTSKMSVQKIILRE